MQEKLFIFVKKSGQFRNYPYFCRRNGKKNPHHGTHARRSLRRKGTE